MSRLFSALFWFSLLVFAVVSAHAASITSTPSQLAFYPVPRVDIAPSVDGVLDDPAWETAPAAPIAWDLTSNQEWIEEQDFIGEFQAVWRDQTLYVAIRLHDDQVDTASGLEDEKDRLLIYVDIDNVGIKADEYRYVLPVQEDRTYEYYPDVFVIWGPVDDVCEFSYDLKRAPRNRQTIGFSVEYHDVDSQEDNVTVGWPFASELEVHSSELGNLMFEADMQRNPQQMTVTWGSIKALF